MSDEASPAPKDLVARVLDLARAAEDADGTAPFDEAVLLDLRHRGLPDDAQVTETGAAWLVRPDDPDHEAADLHLVVHPGARGRREATRLAGRALASYDGEVHAWSHGNHVAASSLARAFDFWASRDLWVMRRPAGDLPPLPERDGVRVRTFDATTDADRDALLAINADAFADHPEQGDLDVAGFEARRAEPWFDPAGIFLAEDTRTGAVLGFHWTKVHPDEGDAKGPGEVYVVGIDPDEQGRGLGSLLTLAGLHDLYERRGVAEVLLYVESDNAPAVTVYSRLGFTHADVDSHVQYTRASHHDD